MAMLLSAINLDNLLGADMRNPTSVYRWFKSYVQVATSASSQSQALTNTTQGPINVLSVLALVQPCFVRITDGPSTATAADHLVAVGSPELFDLSGYTNPVVSFLQGPGGAGTINLSEFQ